MRSISSFGLGEKFVFEPSTEEMFGRALRFAQEWNLHTHVQEHRYDRLIVPAGRLWFKAGGAEANYIGEMAP